jgi:signal transduction histidine kinase
VLDLVLAAACLGLAWSELLVWNEWSDEGRVVQALGITVVCAALAIRRRYPLGAVLVGAAGTGLLTLGGAPPQILAVGLAAMVIAYSFAAGLDGWRLVVAGVVFTATWIARDLTDPQMHVGDIWIDGIFFGMPVLVGRVVRRRERRVELVVQSAEERAEDAVARERLRIARELHDVIAHGISVMVVQADAARHGLDPADIETRTALEQIERTGRSSLREMRALLGLLRDGSGGDASLQPQPGLALVADLVQSVRKAGLSVEVETTGEPRPLAPGIDVAAYRIVQEALTNALRHAGGTRARVQIGYDERQISLRIADSGGRGDGLVGAGKGLVGMRERALLYGGSFAAAPSAEGFVVAATLPYEAVR